MATPEKPEEDPLFAYTCCEVWARVPLYSPCWVCGLSSSALNLDECETYNKWQRPRYLPKQTACGNF